MVRKGCNLFQFLGSRNEIVVRSCHLVMFFLFHILIMNYIVDCGRLALIMLINKFFING